MEPSPELLLNNQDQALVDAEAHKAAAVAAREQKLLDAEAQKVAAAAKCAKAKLEFQIKQRKEKMKQALFMVPLCGPPYSALSKLESAKLLIIGSPRVV